MNSGVLALLTGFGVEELRDRGAFAALRTSWEALLEKRAGRGELGGPFVSPSWVALQAQALTRVHGRLRLLAVHQRGALLGALPLLEEKRILCGIPARILRSISDDHSQRFDAPIVDDRAAEAILDHLLQDNSWDACELRDVIAEPKIETGIGKLIRAAKRRGLSTSNWPSLTSPYLPLPTSFDVLQAKLDAKFRSNLRRRRKKLRGEVGEIELERVPNTVGKRVRNLALDDGFRLEAAGWKGDSGTAIACDPHLVARYRALAGTLAADGRLALYFLRVGGERRAFHFGIVENGVYYLLKPGYDIALGSFGIGHLLVEEVIQDLISHGIKELDFLGENMAWKREWTPLSRRHTWHYLFHPHLWGRTLHAWKFGVLPMVKRASLHTLQRLYALRVQTE